MGRHKKNVNMQLYEVIPKQQTDNEKILALLKEKYDLKIIRIEKTREIKERRKELYNLSVKVNELEEEIDNLLLKRI